MTRPTPLSVLRSLEWSAWARGPGTGPMGSGGDGRGYPSCPVCNGLKEPNREFVAQAVGHKPHCALAAALSATPAPSDQDASQAQGEVERLAQDAERLAAESTSRIDAAELRGFATGLRRAAALPPAPGATAQDGVERIARAICRGEDCPEERWPEYEKAAREVAALTPTPTIPAGMVADADPFDDCLGIHVEANARRFAATTPKQAEQQGDFVAGPSWEDADGDGDGGTLWTAEIQTVGGYCVVATVHGADHAQVTQRQASILAALNAPTGAVEKGEA